MLRNRRIVLRPDIFSPLYISGLFIWFDFSDVSTLYVDNLVTNVSADGQAIYAIKDKSGNARDATQPNLDSRPLYKVNIKNGLSAGLGVGSNDYLATENIQYPQQFTVIALFNRTGGDNYGGPIGCDGGGSPAYVRQFQHRYDNVSSPNTFQFIVFNDEGFPFTNSHPATVANFNICTGIRSGSYCEAFVNGQSNGRTATTGTPAAIGNTKTALFTSDNTTHQNLGGYVCEAMIYNRQVTHEEQQKIEDYLNKKWLVY